MCIKQMDKVGVATQTQMRRITFRQHGTGKPGPDRAGGPGVRLVAQHATGLGHIRSLHPRDEPADGRRLRPLMCGGGHAKHSEISHRTQVSDVQGGAVASRFPLFGTNKSDAQRLS
ncbi:uncharacterized protein LOC143744220 [Siphateles boraxobius]|uniref:uncharacterized protein LOC143744220 n=1 Tax=Siphateles boraxobius TaxID=180520 RepID=UPI0040631F84